MTPRKKVSPKSLENLKKGKPFVKGDPRINRAGRASNFDQLRALIQEIANEEIDDYKEGRITRLRKVILKLSENQLKEFLEFGFGKVPLSQSIDVTSGGKAINWMQFINNDDDNGNTNEDKSEETGQ